MHAHAWGHFAQSAFIYLKENVIVNEWHECQWVSVSDICRKAQGDIESHRSKRQFSLWVWVCVRTYLLWSSLLFFFNFIQISKLCSLGPGQHIYCRRKSSMSATIFTHFDPQSVMLIKSIKSCHECVWISIIINILHPEFCVWSTRSVLECRLSKASNLQLTASQSQVRQEVYIAATTFRGPAW